MEIYQHAKVITGILVGLALAHLLQGIAKVVQHPTRPRRYWVHLVWVAFAFFYIISFWWWEFELQKVRAWNFAVYIFITLYGVLLYWFSTLLFPYDMTEEDGFENYYYAHRKWIFGVLASICVLDLADSLIKGLEYLHSLGTEYEGIEASMLIGCIIAMKTTSARFHAAFAVLGTLGQGLYYIRLFLRGH